MSVLYLAFNNVSACAVSSIIIHTLLEMNIELRIVYQYISLLINTRRNVTHLANTYCQNEWTYTTYLFTSCNDPCNVKMSFAVNNKVKLIIN
jgi:hypothetical protein